MTVLTDQEISWTHEVAGRLRLIQSDAATAAPGKRYEYLQEAVARSLKGVPIANRKRYLEALLARFPVAGQIASSAPPPSLPPALPVPAPVTETPEQMLERFLAAAAKLSDEKRSELSRRLYEAGFGVNRDALVLELSDELKKSLGLPTDQQPRLTRVVELAVLLIDILHRLNHTAQTTLRELSPKSPILERPQDFRSVAARFLSNDDKSLESQLRLASGVPATMLAAIKEKKSAGATFVRRYEERFSSRAIEDVVEAEGGKMFGPNKKERCWDRYRELSTDFADPALIDSWIKDCLGKVLDESLKRLGDAKAPGGR